MLKSMLAQRQNSLYRDDLTKFRGIYSWELGAVFDYGIERWSEQKMSAQAKNSTFDPEMPKLKDGDRILIFLLFIYSFRQIQGTMSAKK